MGNGGTSSPAAARHSHLQPGEGLRAGAPGCAAMGDMRRAGWRALGADRGCLVGSTLPACSTPLGAAPGPAARPRALPAAHGAGAPGSAPCALPGTGRTRRGGARWAQGAGTGSSEPGRAEPGRDGAGGAGPSRDGRAGPGRAGADRAEAGGPRSWAGAQSPFQPVAMATRRLAAAAHPAPLTPAVTAAPPVNPRHTARDGGHGTATARPPRHRHRHRPPPSLGSPIPAARCPPSRCPPPRPPGGCRPGPSGRTHRRGRRRGWAMPGAAAAAAAAPRPALRSVRPRPRTGSARRVHGGGGRGRGRRRSTPSVPPPVSPRGPRDPPRSRGMRGEGHPVPAGLCDLGTAPPGPHRHRGPLPGTGTGRPPGGGHRQRHRPGHPAAPRASRCGREHPAPGGPCGVPGVPPGPGSPRRAPSTPNPPGHPRSAPAARPAVPCAHPGRSAQAPLHPPAAPRCPGTALPVGTSPQKRILPLPWEQPPPLQCPAAPSRAGGVHQVPGWDAPLPASALGPGTAVPPHSTRGVLGSADTAPQPQQHSRPPQPLCHPPNFSRCALSQPGDIPPAALSLLAQRLSPSLPVPGLPCCFIPA